jgi:hypothetical protein
MNYEFIVINSITNLALPEPLLNNSFVLEPRSALTSKNLKPLKALPTLSINSAFLSKKLVKLVTGYCFLVNLNWLKILGFNPYLTNLRK